MSPEYTEKKASSFIISKISMTFQKEFLAGLEPFSREEKIDVIEVFLKSLQMLIQDKDFLALSDFFSEQLLKKYGKRSEMIYNIYVSSYFSREYCLLRFVGPESWHIYTNEEFNNLEGTEGGQILTEEEHQSLLHGYAGQLRILREKELLEGLGIEKSKPANAGEQDLSGDDTPIEWTGSKVDFLKLIYALYHAKLLNSGSGEILRVVEKLARVFKVDYKYKDNSLSNAISYAEKNGLDLSEIFEKIRKGFATYLKNIRKNEEGIL